MSDLPVKIQKLRDAALLLSTVSYTPQNIEIMMDPLEFEQFCEKTLRQEMGIGEVRAENPVDDHAVLQYGAILFVVRPRRGGWALRTSVDKLQSVKRKETESIEPVREQIKELEQTEFVENGQFVTAPNTWSRSVAEQICGRLFRLGYTIDMVAESAALEGGVLVSAIRQKDQLRRTIIATNEYKLILFKVPPQSLQLDGVVEAPVTSETIENQNDVIDFLLSNGL